MEDKSARKLPAKIEREMEEHDFDAELEAVSPFWGALLALGDPVLTIIWAVLMGGHTYMKYLNDRKTVEFLEFLREGQFEEEDLQTEGFREGLRRTFNAFMEERYKIKRLIIKRIFMGFVSSDDKEHFHIERMFHVMQGMDLDDVIALERIKSMVIPRVLTERQNGFRYGQERGEIDKSKTLQQYLIEQSVKGWGFSQQEANQISNGLMEGYANLERLGIVSVKTSSTYDGEHNPSEFKLTPFGYSLSQFIENSNNQN